MVNYLHMAAKSSVELYAVVEHKTIFTGDVDIYAYDVVSRSLQVHIHQALLLQLVILLLQMLMVSCDSCCQYNECTIFTYLFRPLGERKA